VVVALATAAAAAVAAAGQTTHTGLVLALGAVGAALTVAFALLGAPDVALVVALLGNLLTLLLLGGMALLPREVLAREADRSRREQWRGRDLVVGGLAAGTALLFSWSVLSRPSEPEVAEAYVALSPSLGSDDVVDTILTDLRGLDTLGESTVLLIALLGFGQRMYRREP
jgi:multicomponent Na+:H+ antiporter subunit A